MANHPSHPAAPVLTFAPELLLRAQSVRCALFDVDGVLTDGGVLVEADGQGTAIERVKRFHTLDGYGLQMIARCGMTVVVISGRRSVAVQARLKALGIDDVHMGVEDKLTCAQELMKSRGLDWDAMAAIGDDWPDLPLLCRAAFSCAPPGAHAEVRARVHHVTDAPGGGGAAREFCDLLIQAKGAYAAQLAQLVAID